MRLPSSRRCSALPPMPEHQTSWYQDSLSAEAVRDTKSQSIINAVVFFNCLPPGVDVLFNSMVVLSAGSCSEESRERKRGLFLSITLSLDQSLQNDFLDVVIFAIKIMCRLNATNSPGATADHQCFR